MVYTRILLFCVIWNGSTLGEKNCLDTSYETTLLEGGCLYRCLLEILDVRRFFRKLDTVHLNKFDRRMFYLES